MKKMKILLMSYRGNPFCGGQGIYLQYLAEELMALGHTVHVMVGPPFPLGMSGAEIFQTPNNMYFGRKMGDIVTNTKLTDLFGPIHLYEFLASKLGAFPEIQGFSFRSFFQLKKIMERERYDIIHDNQCLGWGFLLIKKLGAPVISTIHHPLSIDRAVWFERNPPIGEKLQRALYYPLFMQAYVARHLDGVITVSNDSAVEISRAFGVAHEKMRVVYNGLNAEIFKPMPEVEKVPNRVIFVGNVSDPKKGVAYLMEAMPLMDERIKLVIVDGGTPPRLNNKDLIAKYNLKDRVFITGKITTSELVRWYASAEVAVSPSLYEGFGFPAAEAMACELPLVASSAGALPEVVGPSGEAGVIVPPRDPQALAKAITELMADKQKREEMGKKARERVLKEFTWPQAARQLEGYYQEFIDAYHRL